MVSIDQNLMSSVHFIFFLIFVGTCNGVFEFAILSKDVLSFVFLFCILAMKRERTGLLNFLCIFLYTSVHSSIK